VQRYNFNLNLANIFLIFFHTIKTILSTSEKLQKTARIKISSSSLDPPMILRSSSYDPIVPEAKEERRHSE
jgi:hypothetical protein